MKVQRTRTVNGKLVPGFNTFYVKFPGLMKESAVLENYLIGVDADNVTDKFNCNVWWECPKCRNKYNMTIKDRVMKQKRGHDPCPRCSGRRQRKTHYIVYLWYNMVIHKKIQTNFIANKK